MAVVRTRVFPLIAAIALGVLGIGVAACGSSSDGGAASSGAAVKGTGSLNGDGKQLVFFGLSSSNSYIGEQNRAAKEEAQKLGYKLKIFENNFDQAQQDQQVAQFVASGQKPAAIMWFPNSSEAGINDTRQLARIAPVIQTNQLLLPQGRPYVKFYVGVNDKLIGRDSAKNLIEARAKDRKDGRELHSKGGNLLIFRFADGYLAGDDRTNAFLAETKSDPFNVLHTEPMPTPDAQSGYKAASALIPKYKSKGIDYVFSNNNNSLVGIARALRENGLTPGKDVILSGGDCSGDMGPFKRGQIYGSVLQSPTVEGKLLVRETAAYLATGKVQAGTYTFPQSVDSEPKATMDPPHQYTFMPAGQMIGGASLEKPAIWGLTADQACF